MNSRPLRYLASFLAVAIGGVTLSACGSSSAPTTLKKITFAYDWISPDMETIPVMVAAQKGYFKAEGLSVNIVFPPSTSSTADFLAQGRAQVGFITTADMADAVAEQVPLESIANFSMSNNWGLFTKPGTKLTLADLRGHKIFSYGDNWTAAMLPFVLKKAGLSANQVTVVSGDYDVPDLLDGKITFSTNTTNYEIPEVEAASPSHQGPGTTLTGSAIGVPNIPIWNYATDPNYAAKHGKVLKEFLAAVLKATQWSVANPVAAVTLFQKVYPEKVNGQDYATNLEAWKLTIPLLTNAQGQYFTETNAQWSTLAQALKSVGQISTVPAPSAYYTNQYQPS